MTKRSAVELIFDERWGLVAFNVNLPCAQEVLEMLGMQLRETDPNVYWIPEFQRREFDKAASEMLEMITGELESIGMDWYMSEATQVKYITQDDRRLAS